MIDMRTITPQVFVLAGGKLVYIEITKCDWCGKTLLDKKYRFKWDEVHIEDDAVRPMYFCSEECQAGFNNKYPSGKGTWPGVKLSFQGLFVRLNQC
jgi:hypothetical protein